MESFTNKLISSLPALIFRGAVEVHKRPTLAAGLYASALFGVFASPFGGVRHTLGATGGRRRRSPYGESGGEPPQASVLDDLDRAGLRVVERVYRPGDEVYTPGDPADSLWFLLSGVVRTYKTYGGDYKEATTALLKDEGVFRILDLAEGGHQEEFAEAVTEVRVASVRKAALRWLVKRKPEASLALFSEFSKRTRQTGDLLESLLQREVASRLAALFLSLAERFGEREEGARAETVTIGLRLTHQQLGSMIASTREAVSKAMTDLRREGLIDVQGRRIVLLDYSALSQRAEGGTGA